MDVSHLETDAQSSSKLKKIVKIALITDGFKIWYVKKLGETIISR